MHPAFHPTLVFSMLDKILDAFDWGLKGTFLRFIEPYENYENKLKNDNSFA